MLVHLLAASAVAWQASTVHAPASTAVRLCAAPASPPVALAKLLDLADQYDAFLLDQFGVIHDGKTAYEGAVEAVKSLQRAGKKIVIISNSSRRKSDTIARLRSMGFGPCEGDAAEVPPISVVTSGDLVFNGLSTTGSDPIFDGIGMRCLVFGNGDDDEQYVRDAGKVASPISQADFLLARGLFSMLGNGPDLLFEPSTAYSAEAEAEVLEAALARRPGGLPLLVANPDEVRPDGKDSPMPGQLARRYRELGATDVRLVGKPYPLIYSACRAVLSQAGLGADARVAAVGDSLHHDVLGAARNGVDSVLCCSGVHSLELGVPQAGAETPEPTKLTALLDCFSSETGGVAPTHVLAAFRI